MKSSNNTQHNVLRKRDFCILCIIAIAIYLSLKTTNVTYKLEPAFYIDQRIGKKSSSINNDWQFVPPLVTDLNGDGSNELIYITKDLHLKVVSTLLQDKNEIYTPVEVTSIRLSSLNIQKGQIPVALKTGYVDEYNTSKERSQIIVVVRDDWTVSAYDASLKLLWEKSVAHKTHEIDTIINKYKIDEVTIHISSLSIVQGSFGVVIIGASMGLRDPNDAHIGVEHGLDMEEDGDNEHADMHLRASLEHFSIYALDAVDGHMIWKHDGIDIRPEEYIKSLPQHAYKLDLSDLATKVHHGSHINHWEIFKQSLITELPHDWHSIRDTSFRLAHFVRKHIGAGSSKTVTKRVFSASVNDKTSKSKRESGKLVSGDASRFTGVESPPLNQGATLPHDASEHTEHPNVIVTHTKKGIEVVALKTGSPITSLALTEGRSYADVDGDGVIDTILLLETAQDVEKHYSFAHHTSQLSHCMIMVISGLPANAQLFNGTICQRRKSLNEPLQNTGNSKIPSAVSAASPVILRSMDAKSLHESKVRDIVVAINTGVVTCYTGEGDLKWQVRGLPTWSLSNSQAASILFDSDATRVEDLGKHDNVYAQILIMGDTGVSLMSRDGDILASAEIPQKPISRPIIGDFDSDGVTDVIICTEDAILGYRLEVEQSVRSMLIAVIVLAVLAGIIFFANIRTDMDGILISSNINRAGKRNVLSLSRSTDEYHID